MQGSYAYALSGQWQGKAFQKMNGEILYLPDGTTIQSPKGVFVEFAIAVVTLHVAQGHITGTCTLTYDFTVFGVPKQIPVEATLRGAFSGDTEFWLEFRSLTSPHGGGTAKLHLVLNENSAVIEGQWEGDGLFSKRTVSGTLTLTKVTTPEPSSRAEETIPLPLPVYGIEPAPLMAGTLIAPGVSRVFDAHPVSGTWEGVCWQKRNGETLHLPDGKTIQFSKTGWEKYMLSDVTLHVQGELITGTCTLLYDFSAYGVPELPPLEGALHGAFSSDTEFWLELRKSGSSYLAKVKLSLREDGAEINGTWESDGFLSHQTAFGTLTLHKSLSKGITKADTPSHKKETIHLVPESKDAEIERFCKALERLSSKREPPPGLRESIMQKIRRLYPESSLQED